MLSKIREAALRHDLGATLWRICVTQDNREIPALLPAQLREMADKYPEDSAQFAELHKLIKAKEAALAN